LRTIILANGELNDLQAARAALSNYDLLIAADGGAHHCAALGVTPDVLIGDLDSLGAQELEAFRAAGVKIIRYSTRKDYTDLELAVRYAQEQGAGEIVILAALGARWDMTLANLLLPAAADLSRLRISLLDGPQEILLVCSGEELELRGRPGDTVSLIPLGGDAHGLTTQGLEYPLHDETLYFGKTRGISNVLTNPRGSVRVREGTVLCVVIHQ
jgi:thiamine pyrophosphokinase